MCPNCVCYAVPKANPDMSMQLYTVMLILRNSVSMCLVSPAANRSWVPDVQSVVSIIIHIDCSAADLQQLMGNIVSVMAGVISSTCSSSLSLWDCQRIHLELPLWRQRR